MKGKKAGVNDEKCHYREEQKLHDALRLHTNILNLINPDVA